MSYALVGLLVFTVGLLLVGIGLWLYLRARPEQIEKRLNTVVLPPPYPIADDVLALHRSLFIADLHSRSLMWGRDLTTFNNYGHADLPRLREANVALQVFGVATCYKMARWGGLDLVGLLARVHRWPQKSAKGPVGRAQYQVDKMTAYVEKPYANLRLVKDKTSLDGFVQDRATNPNLMGVVLSLEGGHAIEKGASVNEMLDKLDAVHATGFRVLGISQYLRDGRQDRVRVLVEKAQSLGMLIDLAGASSQLIEEVTGFTTRPVVVSHTGVRAVCRTARNLTDEAIALICDTGGLIGISFEEALLCSPTITKAAKEISYVVDRFGAQYVALGSGFDGADRTPVEVRGLPLLTQSLLNHGVELGALAKVYGENALRVLGGALGE